jgi:hypothetical protein
MFPSLGIPGSRRQSFRKISRRVLIKMVELTAFNKTGP